MGGVSTPTLDTSGLERHVVEVHGVGSSFILPSTIQAWVLRLIFF